MARSKPPRRVRSQPTASQQIKKLEAMVNDPTISWEEKVRVASLLGVQLRRHQI